MNANEKRAILSRIALLQDDLSQIDLNGSREDVAEQLEDLGHHLTKTGEKLGRGDYDLADANEGEKP